MFNTNKPPIGASAKKRHLIGHRIEEAVPLDEIEDIGPDEIGDVQMVQWSPDARVIKHEPENLKENNYGCNKTLSKIDALKFKK